MLKQYALGIAGGAARVAEHARIALVAAREPGVAVLLADPVLEVRGVLAGVEADVLLDCAPTRLHAVDKRLESGIVS